MATHLPSETYWTLDRRMGKRNHATFAPNTHCWRWAEGEIRVLLHGNLIARLFSDGRVLLSDAGWPTQTTARRLRALAPSGQVWTHAGHTYWRDTDGNEQRLPDTIN
jgi:hypothetical protein